MEYFPSNRCSWSINRLKNDWLDKMGHSRPLVFFLHLFNTVDSKLCTRFANDWIRTADLVSQASALPTEPQSLPKIMIV